jgi:hypothetical protein
MGVLAAIVYSMPPALSLLKLPRLSTLIPIFKNLGSLIDLNKDVVPTNK